MLPMLWPDKWEKLQKFGNKRNGGQNFGMPNQICESEANSQQPPKLFFKITENICPSLLDNLYSYLSAFLFKYRGIGDLTPVM
jgi:hypothetical protein